MKIAVIGGGIMGLCSARALVGAGHSVTLFEQSTIPNPRGSSYDDHRLIRFPYGNMAGYMDMIPDAYTAWEGLWHDLGAEFYYQTGTLVVGTSAHGWASHSRMHLQRRALKFADLSKAELKVQFPFILQNKIEISLLLETGGILEALKVLDALKVYLLSEGVEIHEHQPVVQLNCDQAELQGSGYAQVFDLCIVTAGPWIASLIDDFASLVTPSRQPSVYLSPPPEHMDLWQSFPMLLDIDYDSGFYLVPPRKGTRLKIGDHRFSLKGVPSAHFPATDTEVNNILNAAYRRIPQLNKYPIEDFSVRYYTVSKDERFIARRMGKTWVLTGFSGHGFKFGPLIGNRLAQTIAGTYSEAEFIEWMAGR